MAAHYQITGTSAAEVAASVEAGVRAGDLPAGGALPPVRALAATLGVSPATVAAGYAALRQRGVVETAGRLGTRVRHRPALGVRGGRRLAVPAGAVDLSTGGPDPALLPRLGPVLARLQPDPVGYEAAEPLPALSDLARERLAADGVPVDSLTVTSGALDAIERVLGAHVGPGDRVAVEDPGWANLLDLVATMGLQPVPLPLDEHGPTVDGMRAALTAGARAVVVTSRAQNPTGAALDAPRARALRAVLAERPDLVLVEDDHSGELADVPLHPLAGAVPTWAFLHSVSKAYGPDLRLAVVAGDEATIGRVAGRLRLGAGWVSTILQRTVVELWRDPAVTALVGRAAAEYDDRRRALLAALSARGITAYGTSGINVWVPVPDETGAIARLRDAGWVVAPGAMYRIRSAPALRITVSGLRAGHVDALADAVAAATVARLRPGV